MTSSRTGTVSRVPTRIVTWRTCVGTRNPREPRTHWDWNERSADRWWATRRRTQGDNADQIGFIMEGDANRRRDGPLHVENDLTENGCGGSRCCAERAEAPIRLLIRISGRRNDRVGVFRTAMADHAKFCGVGRFGKLCRQRHGIVLRNEPCVQKHGEERKK